MKIRFHKKFEKQYKKLSKSLKSKIQEVITIFVGNPISPSLRNHPLKGQLKGLRSITVSGNVRIIFKEENEYLVVIFISIGGHDDVYR